MNSDINVYRALGSPNMKTEIPTIIKLNPNPTFPISKFEYFFLIKSH